MAEYKATDFNLKENQKAERKLLVTLVNMGDSITAADGAPEWVPIGVGVEDSSIDFNPKTSKGTDILGITESSVDNLELSQSLSPMTVRGGNPLLFKLNDIVERNALSEFSLFEVMIVKAYINEGTDEAPAYRAEVHKNCTIAPQSLGGSSHVDMPVNIDFSNNKILGTANAYKYGEEINFTPNAA